MENKKVLKIGILGMGQIGSAIRNLEFIDGTDRKILIRDLDRNEFEKGMDILHVCIPYFDGFIKYVLENVDEYGENMLVFIHSTVPIGTTEKISQGHNFVVHSPIRGVHPNLYGGIKIFTKYIGADFAGTGRLAQEHLQALGVHTEVIRGSRNTEAGKIFSTTYYGWNIIFEKLLYKYCEDNKLNFEIVYEHFNNSYNQGYMALGRFDVIRPILEHMEGPIGGHCVIPNLEFIDSPIAEIIKEVNKRYETENNSDSQ